MARLDEAHARDLLCRAVESDLVLIAGVIRSLIVGRGGVPRLQPRIVDTRIDGFLRRRAEGRLGGKPNDEMVSLASFTGQAGRGGQGLGAWRRLTWRARPPGRPPRF